MFERHIYREPKDRILPTGPEYVGLIKYDGANYWGILDSRGAIRFISRRPSVKGGYPDRTESLPHLTQKLLPEFAGNVFNFELIHTGHNKNQVESHSQVSGILNSLPPRAQSTQRILGPIRAVLHNVVNPDFSTFKDKYAYMKKFEKAFGNSDLMFTPELHFGEDIRKLSDFTKREGREGIIVTRWDHPESDNPRLKEKHKILYNLRIVRLLQEVDSDGQPKQSMGAAEVEDASGRIVGAVGTGWSREQRKAAWQNPRDYIGRLIQVESMGLAANRLRMAVYNGDADGEIDLVTA